MSVKLKEIAEYLNVSPSTVSRVLNNKDRVDKETRKRVLDALEKFQYQPNEIARSLKSKTTKTIGMILPDITNIFSATIFKGVEAAAKQNGYYVIFCNNEGNIDREEGYTRFLLQKQISGLIVAICGREAGFFKNYKKSNVPVVFLENMPNLEESFDYVGINNIKASYDLTKHLIETGHKKIGVIIGELCGSVTEERYKGWERALQENNIPIRKKWVGICNFNMETTYRVIQESAYKAMGEFLKQDDRPTAIFAESNFLAYGAMRAITDAGLRIPEDIAIVCFDAIDHMGIAKPQLTSVIQPAEEIGRIAAEIIMRKAVDSKVKIFEKVILEPQLEIKESCGYANKIGEPERRG